MPAWPIFVRSEEDDLLGPRPSTLSWRDNLFWDLPSHLLLLECIPISKRGLRSNIRVQTFALTEDNKKQNEYNNKEDKGKYEEWYLDKG